MRAATRFQGWRRRRRRHRSVKKLGGSLREFVYLDDVSVYSLLASRKGAIATEFTETETASLNSEIGGSLGGGFGIAKADLKSSIETGQSQTSQVLRKVIVQTSFKELLDLEQDTLELRSTSPESRPALKSLSELRTKLDSPAFDGWVVDPTRLKRGALIEVEVALEADPLFRVSSIITTIREIMQENLQIFGTENISQLAEMRSVGRMLESLLAGLIPVRGRLVEFNSIALGEHEVLIHRSLLDDIPDSDRPEMHPVFVVGVAERNLFWKDIRRVLFSNNRYTVFCRLSAGDLSDTWRPVKLVDVLADVHPLLGEQIGELGETALLAMETAADASQTAATPADYQERTVVNRYISLLGEFHERTLDVAIIESIIADLPPGEDWLSNVDSRRPVLAEVARRLDSALNVETSNEIACQFRTAALVDSGLHLGGAFVPPASGTAKPVIRPSLERFLDAEIVAIYW